MTILLSYVPTLPQIFRTLTPVYLDLLATGFCFKKKLSFHTCLQLGFFFGTAALSYLLSRDVSRIEKTALIATYTVFKITMVYRLYRQKG